MMGSPSVIARVGILVTIVSFAIVEHAPITVFLVMMRLLAVGLDERIDLAKEGFVALLRVELGIGRLGVARVRESGRGAGRGRGRRDGRQRKGHCLIIVLIWVFRRRTCKDTNGLLIVACRAENPWRRVLRLRASRRREEVAVEE